MKNYEADFYGSTIQVGVVGHIRDMIKFDGIGTFIVIYVHAEWSYLC